MIRADGIAVAAGGRRILDDVSVAVAPGELVVVLGPNGAGKSTLLGALAGDRRLEAGEVWLADRPLASWSRAERAERRGVLEQRASLESAFRVADVVQMGRAPHHTPERDALIVRAALVEVGMLGAAHRSYPTLSGGEQQRVQLARVLAQLWDTDPCALLLDEPVAALDVAVQHDILRLASRRARQGAAVLVTLHDLNLAARYADRVVLLAQGRVVADGPPAAVLNPTTIEAVFGLTVSLLPDPDGDVAWIVPRPRPREDDAHGAA